MSEHEKENKHADDDMTLEAILAEYKGAAFIESQKKLSKEDLDRKTEQILEETLSDARKKTPGEPIPPRVSIPVAEPTIQLPTVSLSDIEAHLQTAEPTIQLPVIPHLEAVEATIQLPKVEPAQTLEAEVETEKSVPLPPPVPPVELGVPQPTAPPTAQAIPEQVVEPVRRQKLEPGQIVSLPFPGTAQAERAARKPLQAPQVEQTVFTDDELSYADKKRIEDFAASLDELEEALAEDEEDDERGGFFARFGRARKQRTKEDAEEPDAPDLEGRYDDADLAVDGLSPLQAAGRYGRGLSGYQLRGVGTILLALLMLLFTGLGDSGRSLPGFMGSFRGLTATLLFMQLLAMLLTAEVIATGLLDIFRRRLGVETLVTVAALASIADALRVLQAGAPGRGLPYAAVVAIALATPLLGIKSTRNAMKTTLRAAATGSNPYVITSKARETDGGFALLKAKGDLEGFVRKTEQIDFSEYLYTMAAPLLLTMSVVFAALAAFGGGGGPWAALHYFSAMTVISASFTGLLAYGLPYAMLARKLAKVGAALAGWGGAAEVREAKAVIVTDKDVFPTGTTSLSGVKIFETSDEERRRVIAYTASLIIASGTGLSDVFADILRKEELRAFPVEDLTCYEGGGLGAKVGSAEIIVGSASLMNLLGIRLPQNLNVKNAVFTAMGGELAGVFAINYAPQASVMDALVSLFQTKVKPLFAVRDFNISPMMLQNKFHISTEKIDFLSYEERYALSELEADERARPFAVLHREGLRPLVDVITGGKRLRGAVIRNAALSVASSVIGLLLLSSFFWAGAAETASAVNLFYYMAAWLLVECLLSRSVNLD